MTIATTRMTASATTIPHPSALRTPHPSKFEREALILAHMPLVHSLARRYANRGEVLDDLIQVGMVGLIKAVDRFDPGRGSELAHFAAPTILGEIRRHFRDRTWMMHVPRVVQDNHTAVNRTADTLTSRLRRSPSVDEVARELDLSVDDVFDAMAAGAAYRPLSLSRPNDDEAGDEIDIGADDPGFVRAESRVTIAGRIAELPDRERRILMLRFANDMTQLEIASTIGISQMHVSRLLRQTLAELRETVGLGHP
jgi:RNA polymerase sigma-B factor